MHRICSFTLALALALAAPAVGADELPVVGTGDGIPVLKAVGDAFSAEHPSTKVLVPPSIHSSGGIRAVILGRPSSAGSPASSSLRSGSTGSS
jgi:phosphate transport system substrate-binding protein